MDHATPTRDALVIEAAMLGLLADVRASEIILRLSWDASDRVFVWHDSAAWVVAGPGDADPRTFHSGWHEALREARTRLMAG